MTISANVLTGGVTNTTGSSYTTASVTPTANKLQLLFIAPEQSGTTLANPTVTGCGLTWVQVCSTTNVSSGAQNCLIYRALGSAPTAGVITIHDTNTTYQRITWTLLEISGVDTSGSNGSGAIVQSTTLNLQSAVTSISSTYGTTVTAGNATVGIISINSGSQTLTPGSGYTTLDTETIGITQQEITLFAAAAQQTISATFSGTGSSTLAGIELKAAASASIGETLLTSGNSSTVATSYTTASITPSANAQIIVGVMTQPNGGGPSTPTVSGCGLTWTTVAQQPQGSGNYQRTITVFRGTSAAPSAGALTINDTTPDQQCCWSVVQLTNVDPDTPITQVASGQLSAVTNGSISFGSTVDPSDATLAFVGYSANGVLTAGAGWTSIDQQESGTGNKQTLMTEYAATPQTTVSATLPASGNMFIVAIEANLVNSAPSTHTFEYGSFDCNVEYGGSQSQKVFSGSVQVWGVTQQQPVPNAPVIGAATAGVLSATVGFTPAASGPSATSYTAVSSPGGITATGTSSPIGVAGLTAGTPYTFTVYATNATGNSASSAASNSVTPTAQNTSKTLFGVSSTTVSEQNTNYPIFGPSPLCWRVYNTQGTGAINNPAITFRSGDSLAFSTTPYNSPGPTVSVLKTFFNGQPTGRRLFYIPFHEPEDNIASGTLTLANYLALFPTAMTAKQECSHPQDILICVVLQNESYHGGGGRNPETYLPDDTNFDVMGVDAYFSGNIGTPASTIPTALNACISLAAAHGNKLWGVFETGVGSTNLTEQQRLDALQNLSQTIADDNAACGCYFVGKGNNAWVLTSSEASFWKAGQSG